jgi:TolB-like protein
VDFLSLALPEAVVTTLGGRPGVVVKSVRSAAGGDAAEDVGARLAEASADSAVTGSLLRLGERLRVSCRLVAAGGDVLWSDTLDTGVHDLFGVQDEIARRVARAVAPAQATPASAVRGPRPVAAPASPAAYEAYLRANQLAFNTSQRLHARDLYRAALAEDPGYAPAWARLGRVLRVMAKYGQAEPATAYAEAEAAFRRALELDPDLPAAHDLFTYFELEELGRSEDAVRRLLRQARKWPDDPELFAGLVTALRFGGLLEASVEADRRARALDPGARTSVSYTHLLTGDLETAMRYEDQDVPFVRFHALARLDRSDEARAGLAEAIARSTSDVQRDTLGLMHDALAGDAASVRVQMSRVLASGFHDPEGLYFFARYAAKAGVADLALKTLERVVAKGFHVPRALATDPWLATLPDRARLAALVAKAEAGHRATRGTYVAEGGPALLGELATLTP